MELLNKTCIDIIFQSQSDVWSDISRLCRDTDVNASDIHRIMKCGKSENTNKKYDLYFNKFKKWCEMHNVQYLPAPVSAVAVFLSSLVQSAVSNAVFSSYFYSIKWHHDLHVRENPCENKVVNMLCEGARRILSKPVKKKEPITSDIIEKVVGHFSAGERMNDLSDVRICTMFLTGFAGFLRFNELANIKVENIVFHDSYMTIHIGKSKTDVYRQGSEVVIAKTGENSCPVFWMKHYLKLADILDKGDNYIFRSISYFKSIKKYKLCKINKPLSYTRARELLLKALGIIGLDVSNFGLHSLRSGGVTEAAANNVPDRLLKMHGRWKSDISKDGYILESMQNRLSVTKNLNI